MRARLKQGVQRALAGLGYQLVRLPSKAAASTPPASSSGAASSPLPSERSTMWQALHVLAQRLGPVPTIIDVGASNGMWTELAMADFPTSQYLLIEAQPVHAAALAQFAAAHPNVQYILAAAGAAAGEIFFHVGSPFGGRASYTPFAKDNARLPIITVDETVRARQLPGPYLLKLDTHGFEVPIFEGASATLANTAAIIVEAYNFQTNPECLLFHELCAWLQARGFRCVDLVDVLRRPNDDTLWQMDLVFLRADRPEFGQKTFKALGAVTGPEAAPA